MMSKKGNYYIASCVGNKYSLLIYILALYKELIIGIMLNNLKICKKNSVEYSGE